MIFLCYNMPRHLKPVYLKGWVPMNPKSFDIRNLEWVDDARFEYLGEFIGQKIMNHISKKIGWANTPLPEMKRSLHKRVQDSIYGRVAPYYLRNPTGKPNHNPTYKRLIQFSPVNYHANYCQLYFEVYFEGADAFDGDDPQSKLKPKINPPVNKDEIVIFIGIYAGKDQMVTWAEQIKDCEEIEAIAHFDHVNELIQKLSEIDVNEDLEYEPYVVISDIVSRYRVQLIRQSLHEKDWNGNIDSILEKIMSPILIYFTEIGNLQVSG